MLTAEDLSRKFSTVEHLRFQQLTHNVVILEIGNELATAKISLYGGHVLSWWPKHLTEPVLWLSKKADFIPGKAIRGGVPICWPWFGAHPTDKQLPGHGYARISQWDVDSVSTLDGGATEIKLKMRETDLSRAHWPHKVCLAAIITIGRTLTIQLTTTNCSAQDISVSERLHTYFQIGDIAEINIQGLEGDEYVDLVEGNARHKQSGSITFKDELGRIYVNSTSACVIEDPRLKRYIRIEKSGSQTTAVWNPWKLTASKMTDLGPDGWCDMVCVESANALENQLIIKAGMSHSLVVKYSAETL